MKTNSSPARATELTLPLARPSRSADALMVPAHYRQTNNLPSVTGGPSRLWLDRYHIPGAADANIAAAANCRPTPANP